MFLEWSIREIVKGDRHQFHFVLHPESIDSKDKKKRMLL